jgi:flavin-binding protein dodecin
MSVAPVIEISSSSDKSFEDAVQQGVARPAKSVWQLRSALDQRVTSADPGRPDCRL